MKQVFGGVMNSLKEFGFIDVLAILLIAAVIYFTLSFLKKNDAKRPAVILITFIVAGGLIFLLTEKLSGEIFLLLLAAMLIFIYSTFSFEIKREFWKAKKTKIFDYQHTGADSEQVEKSITEIIKALQNMSKSDIGAILILASDNMPAQILESGVIINSEISSQIIESVFFPKSPLHDGAMVISGQKIQAAGCFLPLSQEVNLPKELGTRHRAGIGISEALNVTALIVSEETGIISIAKQGKIRRYVDTEILRNTLSEFYLQTYLSSDKKRREQI